MQNQNHQVSSSVDLYDNDDAESVTARTTSHTSNVTLDGMTSTKKRLRLLTYLCPEIPLDVFTLIRDCFEEATNLEVDLLIENRFPGPPPHRTDPFMAHLADIVVTHSTDYLRLKAAGQKNMELCPAAPVHDHPLAGDRPVYFSEIIIHSANKDKYKSVKDLKGCNWAYTHETSLSGNLIVLDHLKRSLKTNATFFGQILRSGSHHNSIKMVREYRADAAAVDSNVLAGYLREHNHEQSVMSILTLGPLPIYPFLFNTNLPVELKQQIVNALFSLHNSNWATRLAEVGLKKFAAVPTDLYAMEETVQQEVSGMSINTTYY